MINKENFSLNHIILPNLSIDKFMNLTNKIALNNIEIRNDLPNNSIENENPNLIKELSNKHKINILSINALQKFNLYNKERERELLSLCKFAKKIDCKGIVLVPLNTGDFIEYRQRYKLLKNSLKNINIIINHFDLIGYVEPIGFKTSSLRLKSEVAEVIDSLPTNQLLKILHDTFHHYLSEEKDYFADLTGLVHISGVSNKIKKKLMTDNHRELINENDSIDNLKQIKTLINNNYKNVFSFEPFSKKIQNIENPSLLINNNIDFLLKNL